jgi:hypothetical protein
VTKANRKNYNFEHLRSDDVLARGAIAGDAEDPMHEVHRPNSARSSKRAHRALGQQLDTIQRAGDATSSRGERAATNPPETEQSVAVHSHGEHGAGESEPDSLAPTDAEHLSEPARTRRSMRKDSAGVAFSSAAAARRREREVRRERRRSKMTVDHKADMLAQIRASGRERIVDQQREEHQQRQSSGSSSGRRERRRSRKVSSHAVGLSDMIAQDSAAATTSASASSTESGRAMSAVRRRGSGGSMSSTAVARRAPSKPLPSLPNVHSLAAATGSRSSSPSVAHRRHERAASLGHAGEMSSTLSSASTLNFSESAVSPNGTSTASLVGGTESMDSISSHSQVSPTSSPRAHTIPVGPAAGVATLSLQSDAVPESPSSKSNTDRKLKLVFAVVVYLLVSLLLLFFFFQYAAGPPCFPSFTCKLSCMCVCVCVCVLLLPVSLHFTYVRSPLCVQSSLCLVRWVILFVDHPKVAQSSLVMTLPVESTCSGSMAWTMLRIRQLHPNTNVCVCVLLLYKCNVVCVCVCVFDLVFLKCLVCLSRSSHPASLSLSLI